MVVKCDAPCDEHKKVFFGVCGFYVAVLIILIGYVVDNDRKATAAVVDVNERIAEAQVTAQREHAEMMSKAYESANVRYAEIIQRLTRIEAKAGQ